jgi:hypothetical protein
MLRFLRLFDACCLSVRSWCDVASRWRRRATTTTCASLIGSDESMMNRMTIRFVASASRTGSEFDFGGLIIQLEIAARPILFLMSKARAVS